MNNAMIEKKETARAMVEKHQDKIAALLPSHVNVERFAKSALLAISRNSDLEKCTPQSVFTAVLNAAELGLDFTPAKGHAYLVPYKNVASFMPGYRGMIELSKRSGVISRIEAHIVFKNDKFKYVLGLNPVLEHEPVYDGDSGPMIGVYAIAWYNDGNYQYEYMKKADIDKIRARAKTDYVWKSDYEEMARKTVVRRLFKYLPCSPDLDKAFEYDNATTGIETIESSGINGERTSELADLVSGLATDNTTEAEYEDLQETPSSKTEKPKTKDEFIAAIDGRNTNVYKYADPVYLGICGHILNKPVEDLDVLTVKELEKLFTVFSDESETMKAADAYDAAVNGGKLNL